MTTVRAAFEQMIQQLELTEAERAEASRQQNDLRTRLVSTLTGVEEQFLTGSYARHTAIRPLHDIDLFMVLNDAVHGYRRSAPISHVLYLVQRALKQIYPNKDPAILQNRSVHLDFKGTGIGYDIVPAFRERVGSDVYLIPDRRAEHWIRSNPRAHEAASTLANEKAGKKLKPLIKVAKHWNVHQGKPLASFHLEVMAYGAFSSAPASYPEGLVALFGHLSNAVLHACPDPTGLGPDIDQGLGGQDQLRFYGLFHSAMEHARQAINLDARGLPEQAHLLWRALLGEVYPECGRRF
ncbi:MAG: nucleotidyltransferase [Proteobacteria bacterium]|nr:nucleotidyltransferase [Pseudomonadota bacterium]